MRILKFFFLSLLWILAATIGLFFVGREILLFASVNMLKNDYNSINNRNYSKRCIDQFNYNQDYFTQLRFTSDKEYNLEVVCVDFIASPIVLDHQKLPPLVFKKSFGSGFQIDESRSPFIVELSILGRRAFVYTDNADVHYTYFNAPDLDYDQGPTSTCQGHNYQCCSLDLQSGLGSQISLVNDCPKSCYESCLLRPMFLSFKSQPVLNDENNLVELFNNETLTLSYVLGNGKGDVFSDQLDKNSQISFLEKLQAVFSKRDKSLTEGQLSMPLTIQIDFGDGKVWTSNNFQDTVDHNYACQTQTCYFQVKITAQDAKGVLSVNNDLSKMIVKVHR